MTKLELPDGMGPAEALRGLADDLLAPDAKLRAFVDFGKEGRWDSGPLEGATHGGFLRLVADLIDRKTTRNPADDVTMSAYDLLPEEDRKAIAWVRENGGFEEVKDYYECGRRIEPWNEQKADLYELMNECGGVEEIKKRLMPAGMEWPRFENGEPVRPGNRLMDNSGDWFKAVSFVFTCDWWSIEGYQTEDFGDLNDKTSRALKGMAYGTRVKRPAPKVLDSEGVECNVGDAVWWVRNKTGNFRIIRIDKYGKCAIHDDDADEPCGMTVPSTELTHKRPAIDADGVEIRVGDTVYDMVGDRHEVKGFGKQGDVLLEFHNDESLGWRPSNFTHRAPVLAADGKPLREGEHVYHVETGAELVVKELPKPGEYQAVVVFAPPASHLTSFDPDQLTHERPDSWERLEEDAGKNPFDYCKDVGHRLDTCENSEAYKARDLVRRCKAMAERERRGA